MQWKKVVLIKNVSCNLFIKLLLCAFKTSFYCNFIIDWVKQEEKDLTVKFIILDYYTQHT